MNNFSSKNDDWGNDKFQESFIKEYYNATSASNVEGYLKKSKNKIRKNPVSAQKINKHVSNIKANKKNSGTFEMKKLYKQPNIPKNIHSKELVSKFKQSYTTDVNSSASKKKKVKRRRKHSSLSLKTINKTKSTSSDNIKSPHLLQTNEEILNDYKNNRHLKQKLISDQPSIITSEKHQSLFNQRSHLVKEKAMKVIQAAKFRLLNEKLYSVSGESANKLFYEDRDSFYAYHQGYQNQVSKWPVNPVDVIIRDLRQYPNELVIADLGCGDAKIARTFPKRKINSFDLVALNEHVICCDISKIPLKSNSVDIAVFCLSLMGTNLSDYILEAHRVLKFRGIMKIAEVESRLEDLTDFIKSIEAHGFTLVKKDESYKMFILLDFNKVKKTVKSSDRPTINLNPCLYKKR